MKRSANYANYANFWVLVLGYGVPGSIGCRVKIVGWVHFRFWIHRWTQIWGHEGLEQIRSEKQNRIQALEYLTELRKRFAEKNGVYETDPVQEVRAERDKQLNATREA